MTSENPELVDYKVLAVKQSDFDEVDINNSFFDSFREDYNEFDQWYKSKFDKNSIKLNVKDGLYIIEISDGSNNFYYKLVKSD